MSVFSSGDRQLASLTLSFFVENKSIFSLLLKEGYFYTFTTFSTFWMRRCEKRERLDRQNSSHYGLHQPFSSAIFKPSRRKDKTQLKLRFRTTVFCGLSWIKYLFFLLRKTKLAYANFIRNVAVQLVIEKGRLAFRARTRVPLLPKNKK